jgi:hypothetical protein
LGGYLVFDSAMPEHDRFPSEDDAEDFMQHEGGPFVALYRYAHYQTEVLRKTVLAKEQADGRRLEPNRGFFSFKGTDYQPVSMGVIDGIRVKDWHIEDYGLQIGCGLRSDGSPYMFESDYTAGKEGLCHDLVLTPEHPPVIGIIPDSDGRRGHELIAYFLGQVRQGALEGHILSELDCAQMVRVIADSALDYHLHWKDLFNEDGL